MPSPDDEQARLSAAGSPTWATTIFVSAPDSGGRVMSFNNVPKTLTVDDFKDLIQQRTGDDPEMIRIMYAGKELESVRNNKSGTPPIDISSRYAKQTTP